jgi:hypothetical protein
MAEPAAPPPRRVATSVLIAMAMFLAGVIAVGAIWLVQRNQDSDEAPAAASTPTTAATAATTPEPAAIPAPPSAVPPAPQIGAPVPGSATAVEPTAPTVPDPMIEFEPDPIARAIKTGSVPPTRKRRPEPDPVDEDPAALVPSNRPGSLILVLETASTIEIDGVAVEQSSKGGRFEVKPGNHEVRVKAPGRQPVVRSFEVEAGGTAVIRVADE